MIFSIDEFANQHKSQIIIGRKTAKQMVEYILRSLPATIVPTNMIDPAICECFIETLSNNPYVLQDGMKVNLATCQLIRICANSIYTDYIEYLCKWIYVLIEMQTGELESNCSNLTLDLYVYRGISEKALAEKGTEYLIYMNYLKRCLDEVPTNNGQK